MTQETDIHAKVIEMYFDDRVGFVEDIIFNHKKGYAIDEPQKKILLDLDHGKNNLAVKSGKGVGKLLCYDAIVPTPTGERPWGHLTIGDELFDENGNITKIIGRRDYQKVPIYRVTFDDGSYCDVSSGHLWTVRGREERKRHPNRWLTLTTLDLLNIGLRFPMGETMGKRWDIPVQGPAQFKERKTKIHPYLMGVWLGDGTRRKAEYTKPHLEIKEKVSSFGYKVQTKPDGKGQVLLGQSHNFRGGVFDCYSYQKYIPEEYKYNSIENRKHLLCGLLDTDGECNKNGSIFYATTSKRLAEDVAWLVRSLGGKATMQKEKNAFYYNSNRERVYCKPCYRLTIALKFNPFTIKHRKERYKPASQNRYFARFIDSIDYIGKKDGMCVEVENKSGLYLANDFIVTHNSCLGSWIIIHYLITRPRCIVTATAPSANQLRDVLWPEIKRWLTFMSDKENPVGQILASQFKWTSETVYHRKHGDIWFAAARTASKDNPQALAGRHSEYNLNFIDEASDVSDTAIEIMEGNYGTKETVTILMGNPVNTTGNYYRIFNEKNPTYVTHTISCLDSRIASFDFIEKMAKRYGEESDIYKSQVLGEFPQTSTSSFIPYSMARKCVKQFTKESQGSDVMKCMGIDVGYTGDASIVSFRTGNVFDKWKEYTNKDPIQLAEAVARDAIRFKPRYIMIDSNGIGLGCSRRLKQLLEGHPIEILEVNVSSNASDDRMYYRLRDELWGRFKEELRLGSISLWDNEDEDLCGELSSPMYKVEGVIKVESKPDMKKRGVKSPNIADAHILTCYLPSEDYHLTNYQNSDTIFTEQEYSPFDAEAGY